jgi:hypothetical protein
MFNVYGPPEVLNQVDLPMPVPRGDQSVVAAWVRAQQGLLVCLSSPRRHGSWE